MLPLSPRVHLRVARQGLSAHRDPQPARHPIGVMLFCSCLAGCAVGGERGVLRQFFYQDSWASESRLDDAKRSWSFLAVRDMRQRWERTSMAGLLATAAAEGRNVIILETVDRGGDEGGMKENRYAAIALVWSDAGEAEFLGVSAVRAPEEDATSRPIPALNVERATAQVKPAEVREWMRACLQRGRQSLCILDDEPGTVTSMDPWFVTACDRDGRVASYLLRWYEYPGEDSENAESALARVPQSWLPVVEVMNGISLAWAAARMRCGCSTGG